MVGGWSVFSGLEVEGEGEGEKEVRWRKNRGERKKYKINDMHSYSTRVYLHGYYSNCVNLHNFRQADVEEFWG